MFYVLVYSTFLIVLYAAISYQIQKVLSFKYHMALYRKYMPLEPKYKIVNYFDVKVRKWKFIIVDAENDKKATSNSYFQTFDTEEFALKELEKWNKYGG